MYTEDEMRRAFSAGEAYNYKNSMSRSFASIRPGLRFDDWIKTLAAYEYNPNGKWEDCSKQDYELWHEKYPEDYRKKLVEKLRGEAKTPDQQQYKIAFEKIKIGLQQMKDEAKNMLSPDGRFGQRAEDRNYGIEVGADLALTMVKLIEEKELTDGSVPTPSDEEIEDEAKKQIGVSKLVAFEEGATWMRAKWLRSSTEQNKEQKS